MCPAKKNRDGHPSNTGATLVRGFELFGEEVSFLGRREELAFLGQAWSDVEASGEGVVLLLWGDRGVGKTRLAYEFAKVVDKKITVLRVSSGATSPRGSSGLAGQILRERFRLPSASAPDAVRAKLRDALAEMLSSRQLGDAVQLFAFLLGLPGEESSEKAQQLMWERGISTLTSLLKQDMKKRGLLILVDRVGEADDRDRQLLSKLATACSGAPLLMVWVGLAQGEFPDAPDEIIRKQELRKFDAAATNKLAGAMLERMNPPPDQLLKALAKRAGGNPRIMEQVLRALVTKGIVDTSADPWVFRSDRLAKGVKLVSAEDTARERLDALEPGLRDILEKAATAGPVFWFSGVLYLMRVERDENAASWVDDRKRNRLNRVLLDLQNLDLVRLHPESRIAGDQEYSFQSETEAGLLLEGMRAEPRDLYHGLMAHWMRRAADRASDPYAWHLATAEQEERSGRRSEAARQRFHAARVAYARLQVEGAAGHLQEAAGMLREDEGALRYDVHMLWGEVALQLGRSDEAATACENALRDSVVLDDKGLGARAYVGVGRALVSKGDFGQAAEMMRRARALFQEVDDGEGVALALDELGHAIWLRGAKDAYREALGCFLKALSLRRKLDDPALLGASLTNLARIHLGNGYALHARKYAKEAISVQKRLNNTRDMVANLTLLGSTWFEVQDYRRCLDIWSRALVAAEDSGDRSTLSRVLNCMGEAYLKLEDFTTARVYLREAQQIAREVGEQNVVADAMRNEAMGLLLKGDVPGALVCVQEAVAVAEAQGAPFQKAMCSAARAKVMGEAVHAGIVQETADVHREISQGFSQAVSGLAHMGSELSRGRVLQDYAVYLLAIGSERGHAVNEQAAEILARRKEEAPE